MEHKYSGIVFDFNGTLFWDTPFHLEAWVEYCTKHSIPLSTADFYRKVHGKDNETIFEILYDGRLTPDEVCVELEEKESLYREICVRRGLGLAPGAEYFLNYLKSIEFPFTIATASYKTNVDFFYEYARLDRWFRYDDLVFLDGTMPGKPDPAMYLKAMKILGKNPSDVLVFEDSPPGIQAAINAKAGNILIVDSDGRDYSSYPYEVIHDFHEAVSRF